MVTVSKMMKPITITFSELQDHYNALCKRCDVRIDVCNEIIATADNPDTTARMRARIREEQHLKTGYEIFYNGLRAYCESKTR